MKTHLDPDIFPQYFIHVRVGIILTAQNKILTLKLKNTILHFKRRQFN